MEEKNIETTENVEVVNNEEIIEEEMFFGITDEEMKEAVEEESEKEGE